MDLDNDLLNLIFLNQLVFMSVNLISNLQNFSAAMAFWNLNDGKGKITEQAAKKRIVCLENENFDKDKYLTIISRFKQQIADIKNHEGNKRELESALSELQDRLSTALNYLSGDAARRATTNLIANLAPIPLPAPPNYKLLLSNIVEGKIQTNQLTRVQEEMLKHYVLCVQEILEHSSFLYVNQIYWKRQSIVGKILASLECRVTLHKNVVKQGFLGTEGALKEGTLHTYAKESFFSGYQGEQLREEELALGLHWYTLAESIQKKVVAKAEAILRKKSMDALLESLEALELHLKKFFTKMGIDPEAVDVYNPEILLEQFKGRKALFKLALCLVVKIIHGAFSPWAKWRGQGNLISETRSDGDLVKLRTPLSDGYLDLKSALFTYSKRLDILNNYTTYIKLCDKKPTHSLPTKNGMQDRESIWRYFEQKCALREPYKSAIRKRCLGPEGLFHRIENNHTNPNFFQEFNEELSDEKEAITHEKLATALPKESGVFKSALEALIQAFPQDGELHELSLLLKELYGQLLSLTKTSPKKTSGTLLNKIPPLKELFQIPPIFSIFLKIRELKIRILNIYEPIPEEIVCLPKSQPKRKMERKKPGKNPFPLPKELPQPTAPTLKDFEQEVNPPAKPYTPAPIVAGPAPSQTTLVWPSIPLHTRVARWIDRGLQEGILKDDCYAHFIEEVQGAKRVKSSSLTSVVRIIEEHREGGDVVRKLLRLFGKSQRQNKVRTMYVGLFSIQKDGDKRIEYKMIEMLVGNDTKECFHYGAKVAEKALTSTGKLDDSLRMYLENCLDSIEEIQEEEERAEILLPSGAMTESSEDGSKVLHYSRYSITARWKNKTFTMFVPNGIENYNRV